MSEPHREQWAADERATVSRIGVPFTTTCRTDEVAAPQRELLMSQRIEDFRTWKVGGYLATAAVLAWVFRFVGPALVLALIGAGFMVSAFVAKRRESPVTDSPDTAPRL
jgi:hypothetical protein